MKSERMNCKSCQNEISAEAKFCDSCGAPVVTERISLKRLGVDFFQNVFGWDNRFLMTIRSLLFSPDTILKEYIGGARKKYANPFAFLALAATIGLLSFGLMSDRIIHFTQEMTEIQTKQMNEMSITMLKSLKKDSKFDEQEFRDGLVAQNEQMGKQIKWMVTNYNYYMFLSLPLYALFAFIIYRKPYNYGEHLVINSYIMGIIILLGLLNMVLSVFVSSSFYSLSFLVTIFYYTYAYSKLYQHSIWDGLLRLFYFFLLIVGLFVGIFLIGAVIGFIRHGG